MGVYKPIKSTSADIKSRSNPIILISNNKSTEDQDKSEMSGRQTSVKVESEKGVLKFEKKTKSTTGPAESPDLLPKSTQKVATKKEEKTKKEKSGGRKSAQEKEKEKKE